MQCFERVVCRCTGNRGATVHLLEGPIAAHLHRHVKIFINTPRAQDPRGGASREEVQDITGEGLPQILSERHHPTKDSSTSFSTKEPAPSKGRRGLLPSKRLPTIRRAPRVKAQPPPRSPPPSLPPASILHHLFGGTTVFFFYSSGQVVFLMSTPVATPPSSLS